MQIYNNSSSFSTTKQHINKIENKNVVRFGKKFGFASSDEYYEGYELRQKLLDSMEYWGYNRPKSEKLVKKEVDYVKNNQKISDINAIKLVYAAIHLTYLMTDNDHDCVFDQNSLNKFKNIIYESVIYKDLLVDEIYNIASLRREKSGKTYAEEQKNVIKDIIEKKANNSSSDEAVDYLYQQAKEELEPANRHVLSESEDHILLNPFLVNYCDDL